VSPGDQSVRVNDAASRCRMARRSNEDGSAINASKPDAKTRRFDRDERAGAEKEIKQQTAGNDQ
jgi:hypothetical protein